MKEPRFREYNFRSNKETVLLKAEADRRAGAIEAFGYESEAWEEACRQKNLEATSGESQLSDELVVFWAAAPLAAAALVEELNQSLSVVSRENYNEVLWAATVRDKTRDLLGHLYENQWYGLSLTDILMDGDRLAKEVPVETYGFMLRSLKLSDQQDEVQNGIHAFAPILEFTAKQLEAIVKGARFPKKAADTLISLSTSYQKSLSAVKEAFFEPNTELFLKALHVYDDVLQDPLQRHLFESQIFGEESEGGGRTAYLKARENVKSGENVAFYESIISLIEHRYADNFGEEVYGLLDIEELPGAEVDHQALSTAHIKKRKFLKLSKQASGEKQLDNGMYGDLALHYPAIHYEKNGIRTLVTLAALAKTGDDDGYVPIRFSLHENGGYDWNFLRSEEEVPELFNAVIHAVNCALEEAIVPPRQVAMSDTSAVTNKQKVHFKDPIYDLRKNAVKDQEATPSVEAVSPLEISESDAWQVVCPETVFENKSQEVIDQATLAIEKFQQGLFNSKQLHVDKGEKRSGKKSIRLQQGKIRVVLEKDEKNRRYIVVNAGYRHGIYRKKR